LLFEQLSLNCRGHDIRNRLQKVNVVLRERAPRDRVRAEYAKRTRAPRDDYDGPADDPMVQQDGWSFESLLVLKVLKNERLVTAQRVSRRRTIVRGVWRPGCRIPSIVTTFQV
jgi:hypothetical protein